MEIWHIRGGNRLNGTCQVQGSKNASLPILAASILAPMRCELHHIPELRDVDAALRILRHLGCRVIQEKQSVYIDSTGLSGCYIPNRLMEEMRSSVIFMGALLARCGEANLSLPGGCHLGKRPIDLHLMALRQMGAEIEENGRELHCTASGLHGADIRLPFPSVGATENAMLAACAAKGETRIYGAAREPEIKALQDFLSAAGVEIHGAGSDTICIIGRPKEKDVVQRIIPDRIVASTIACALAASGGDIELRGINPGHFSTVLHFLNEAGCDIIKNNHALRIRSDAKLRGIGPVITEPYPGFPTDAQPVLMAAVLKAEGRTKIRETIFENRFRQVPELRRLGAKIVCSGQTAEIFGVPSLHGASLTATDLRGGASMIVAGLAAEGETVICDDGHITRGYERFDNCLRALGADVYLEY